MTATSSKFDIGDKVIAAVFNHSRNRMEELLGTAMSYSPGTKHPYYIKIDSGGWLYTEEENLQRRLI